MTRHTRILSALAAAALSGSLLACASATGVEEPAPGPALWRVSDADTTLYLFGLPNMMDGETDWRTAVFETALDEADRVLLEADRSSAEAQAAIQQAVPQIGVYRDGRTLSAVLDEDTQADAERVAGSLGVPFQALQPLKPWLAANQLQAVMVQRSGLMNPQTPSAVIASEAAEAGTPVAFLEEPTTLLLAISELPEESHIRLFDQALDIVENDPEKPQRILSMWSAGDVEAMTQAFHGEGQWADEAVRSATLLDRNALWEARLEALLDSEMETYFAAVGVGHLVGEDSIVAGLEAAGYSVTRQ